MFLIPFSIKDALKLFKKKLTSATTPMQPHMVAAFDCAPLIPPRPEDTNTYCIFHIYKNKYEKKYISLVFC